MQSSYVGWTWSYYCPTVLSCFGSVGTRSPASRRGSWPPISSHRPRIRGTETHEREGERSDDGSHTVGEQSRVLQCAYIFTLKSFANASTIIDLISIRVRVNNIQSDER